MYSIFHITAFFKIILLCMGERGQYFEWKLGCNIGSKTLLAEWGMLPLKFTCPASTSTCPDTLFQQMSCIARTLPKTLIPTEQGKLGSCSACLHAVFCQIHLQRGKWLCCILETLSMMKSMKSEMWLNMNIPAEIDKMMHLFTKCLLCLPLHFGNKPSDCFQVMNTQHKHDDAQTQGMACIEDMPTTDWQHMSLHSYRMHDCILAGMREIKTGRFMSVVDSR